MAKVFISTVPFGSVSPEPLKLLSEVGIEVVMNSFGRKMTTSELADSIKDADYLIAGTEMITPEVIDRAKNLRLIARVGVGLDNVPFEMTKQKGIKVSYTPDAPTRAVAELTIGLIVNCARAVSSADRSIRSGNWSKKMGVLLSGKTVGIIGLGRIGKQVVKLLKPFGMEILVNDILPDKDFISEHNVTLVSKEEIFERSDFISLHLNYSEEVKNMINSASLSKMKKGAYLINTARGGIINEEDLKQFLETGHLSGAAIDVFENEPYTGSLKDLPNIILTAHMGAATNESRFMMETQATQEVVRFHLGQELNFEVENSNG